MREKKNLVDFLASMVGHALIRCLAKTRDPIPMVEKQNRKEAMLYLSIKKLREDNSEHMSTAGRKGLAAMGPKIDHVPRSISETLVVSRNL